MAARKYPFEVNTSPGRAIMGRNYFEEKINRAVDPAATKTLAFAVSETMAAQATPGQPVEYQKLVQFWDAQVAAFVANTSFPDQRVDRGALGTLLRECSFVDGIYAQAQQIEAPATKTAVKTALGPSLKAPVSAVVRGYATATYGQHAKDDAAWKNAKLKWVTYRDPNTRPTHAAADGQVATTSSGYKGFQVGGYKLRWPGDTLTAPIEETAGCRCVLIEIDPWASFMRKTWDKTPVNDEELAYGAWAYSKERNVVGVHDLANKRVKTDSEAWRSYAGTPLYREVNDYMRGWPTRRGINPEHLESAARRLDKSFDGERSITLQQDKQTKRWVRSIDPGVDKKGNVIPGYRPQDYRKGDRWVEPGFTSVTVWKNHMFSQRTDVEFHIVLPAGEKIIPGNFGEAEIVVRAGAEYEVTRDPYIDPKSGKHIIEMRLVKTHGYSGR